MAPRDEARPSQKHRDSASKKHHHKKRKQSSRHHASGSEESRSGTASSHALSADALARLNEHNTRHHNPHRATRDFELEREEREEQERRERKARRERERKERERREREQRRREARAREVEREEYREVEREEYDSPRRDRKRKKRRVVSGAALEEGRSRDLRGIRGGGVASSNDSLEKEDVYRETPPSKWNKKRLLILGAIGLVILIVVIVVAVVVSKKKSSSSKSTGLSDVDPSSIPSGAPDYLNPFTWVDTTDFNLTYTDVLVGGLPIMGLNSTWDDSNSANKYVPALDESWGSYADRPARGVNLGGWLSLEPFITPDLFNYNSDLGIIDEYTLCTYLGSSCNTTLETHYSTFVTEATFSEIADAGLDHVRIPYSYWAVETYPGDPYLFRTSWRYLLRGIEWARKYGLRVNLDLHALPGSQNGWNHSGRQGPIGWMNGTDGDLNVQRSIDIHDKLSQFFAQDRYQNIISHYGLVNEPRMTFLSATSVVNWTETVYDLVRKNGVTNATVVFGDGFMGLANWQGKMTGYSNLALDVHQYVIFNNEQIVYNHTAKVDYACEGWTLQTEQSMDTSTGFGPTLIAEWSQADTDCATYLTNVGWGNRWTGTYNTGNASDPLNALTPRCPTENSSCSCTEANADPSTYSDDYKSFLLMFAEAQMYSFEKGWGWFYWTWWTSEDSTQWSYKKGMEAGILPQKAYARDFYCNNGTVPSFSALPETY